METSQCRSVETSQCRSVEDDFESLYSIIINQLDRYAPIKQRRVKSRRLPDWYTPEIGEARKIRDKYKHSQNWSEYKRYRNKTSKLIKNAKRNHFSDSIENFKDTKTIWKHLRTINTSAASTNNTLPSELKFANETLTDSKEIATKLNEYFASVAKVLNSTNTETSEPDLSKLQDFVNGKVPNNVSFKLPYITCDQVASYISGNKRCYWPPHGIMVYTKQATIVRLWWAAKCAALIVRSLEA